MLSRFRDKTTPRHSVPSDDIAQLQFQVYAYFLNVDHAKNRHRFYMIRWQKSLWEGGAIVRSWGRIGCKGRNLTAFYQDRASAQDTIDRLVRRRIQRGYRVVESL